MRIFFHPKHHKLFIAGDFNAETSLVYNKTEYDNGQRLKSFTRHHKLYIPQSFFENPLVNRYTWYSCNKKTKKILDEVLLQRFVNQCVNDCHVKPEYDFESNHRLLATSLSTPKRKKTAMETENYSKTETASQIADGKTIQI